MSQKNVEVVRGHIKAFRRGDVPGALSYLDRYVVWDPSRVRPLDFGGRGKSSGVPVRQTLAALYTVIDGKIARVTFFADEEQALEAAGLRE